MIEQDKGITTQYIKQFMDIVDDLATMVLHTIQSMEEV